MGMYPRPTLTDVREFGEYATTFRWILWMPSPPAITELQQNLGAFNVLCESSDLPSKTVDKILLGLRGHKHYQPGIVAPTGTITLNFVENVTNDVHRIFWYWQEAIWGHNTGIGIPYNSLVADVAITRLDNADNDICTYYLRYCFLESYTLPRMDGATSGPLMTSITLSYDDFFIQGLNLTPPESINDRLNPRASG